MAEMDMHPGLAGGPIYLDYNATTPVDPRVVDAVMPWLATHFGNPSSSHRYADVPRQALAEARGRLSELLGCTPGEIVFTGGGSESDALAVRGGALARRERGDHVVVQQTEHPAVLEACRDLARLHGFRVTWLPVDAEGRVAPAALEAAIEPGTVLVTIQHANGETGTVQPIRELAAIAHRHGALFHTDAAQSVGKIPVAVDDLGVDLLTVVGHKMYAPKGVGALYVRSGLALEPTVRGGGQERGLRGGTENVALIAGLGVAAMLAADALPRREQLRRLRDRLHERLRAALPGAVQLNGHPHERLPNTLNVSIEGASSRQLLAATPEIAASTGSACHEGRDEPSEVLLAMGLAPDRALSAVRLTLGRWTTEDDVERAARLLVRSRQKSGIPQTALPMKS
jgi:cysteine desulfurase